jgi:hypothetical protein
LLRRKTGRGNPERTPKVRPAFEALEERALLSTVTDSSLIVHTQGDTDDDDDVPGLRADKAPSNLVLNAPATVDEGDSMTLNGSFVDPSKKEKHSVLITWGSGSSTMLDLPAGVTTFSATHLYPDDMNPTRTDDFTIQATVTDDDGGTTTASTQVVVKNLAPSNLVLNAPPSVLENGTIALTGSFADPSRQDTHTVSIQWGDGGSSKVNLGPGVTSFRTTYRYLDVGPAGAAANSCAIAVTVTDDDGGSVTGSRNIIVNNVAPTDLDLDAPARVNENSPLTLTGTFTDPGTLDTHTVSINWGDGNQSTLNLGQGVTSFNTTHTYTDDSLGGSAAAHETIVVVVQDKGGALDTASASVQVVNVPPSNLSLHVSDINENDIAVLSGSFSDPHTRDTHTVVLNWDDGSPTQTLNLAAGVTTFTATHRYLDDDLGSGSPSGYTITARVTDDNGGTTTASANLTVNNVAPSNLVLNVPQSVNENDPVSLTGSFADPGTLDTHTAVVNWGDGTSTTVTLAAGVTTFTATHQYADESTGTGYALQATVTDDDGGSATASSSVLVNSVTPANLSLSAQATANQGDPVNLAGSFTDPSPEDTHTVVVNWDDAGAPQGAGSTTLMLGAGVTTFSTMHQYLQTGAHNITVHVTDNEGASVDGSAAVTVGNAGIIGTGAALTGHAYTPFTNVQVGSFTYAQGLAGASALTATIDWGDGTNSPGTVVQQQDGSYVVNGTHTYQARGTFTVKVNVGQGSPGATIAGTATVGTELMPDGSVGTPNQQFIAEVYRALLERQVDQAGLDFWSHMLAQGMNRAAMVDSLQTSSTEYRFVQVQELYERYLGRAPEGSALNWGVSFLRAGGTMEQLSSLLISSQEYLNRAGGTNEGFVEAVYHDILGRTVDDSGRAFDMQMMSQGSSRQQLAMALFSSQEYCQNTVNSIYGRFLGRQADASGMTLFSNFFRQGMRQEEIIAALMGEMETQEFAHSAA